MKDFRELKVWQKAHALTLASIGPRLDFLAKSCMA